MRSKSRTPSTSSHARAILSTSVQSTLTRDWELLLAMARQKIAAGQGEVDLRLSDDPADEADRCRSRIMWAPETRDIDPLRRHGVVPPAQTSATHLRVRRGKASVGGFCPYRPRNGCPGATVLHQSRKDVAEECLSTTTSSSA